MYQENRSGDRSATSRLAEAELLPLLTAKLNRPPVTFQYEQSYDATQKATCCQRRMDTSLWRWASTATGPSKILPRASGSRRRSEGLG
jgi:hypothetical protein